MFEEAFNGGTVLRFHEEHISEDRDECLVQFKVSDTKIWGAMLPDLVLTIADGEEYGAELRKNYYVEIDDSGKKSVRYLWAIFFWAASEEGILEAVEDVRPFFSRALQKPEPTRALRADPRTKKRRARLVTKTTDHQGNEVGTVVLPHAPADRNNVPKEQRVTGLHDKRRTKARAEAYSGEGMPDAPEGSL